MARIVGVDIPNEKRIVVSLTYIYGIGDTTAKKICAAVNISEDIRTKNLTDEQLTALRAEVAKYHTEGDLRREVALNISASPKSAATVASATKRAFRSAASALVPMPVPAKVRGRPSPTRKRPASNTE